MAKNYLETQLNFQFEAAKYILGPGFSTSVQWNLGVPAERSLSNDPSMSL